MAWIRDAVGLSLSAAALAVVSILATRFARPLVWFPHSPRGLQVDMAWIGDAVGMSLSAAALAVVSILAIYFACPLLFPHSSRGLRLEGAISAEDEKEDEEEGYEIAEEKNDDKDEGDEAAEGKTEEKEEDEEENIGEEEKKEDEEGGIGWILSALNSFQAYFSSPAPTPSPQNVFKKLDLLKLNDYVYELCKPSGRPSVEIVFFHGFQLGRSSQTYATTWLSRNGSELWPSWIRKSVPEVRILLVSYDGSATKKDDRGRTDMYITSENLVQSLTGNDAQVGQDGCPVILVGHSLGGLVIKEILLQANKVLSLDKPENPNLCVQSFLENVKQLFYYSCPHNGTRLADDKTLPQKGQLFKLLRTLNKKAARCNEEFRKLRDKFKWGAYSIAEKLPADLGSLGKQVVVEEASARHDTEGYYTADADHFSVCQPASDTDSSFSTLRDIIDCTRREVVCGHQIKTPTTLVGLNDQITKVTTRLRTTRYLSICGIGGIGKSTLAMAVYNAISGEFEYTSFVSEVKKLVGEKVSIEDLQAEKLKNLYYKGRKCEATSGARWNRFKGRKVLIILDDVEYESQVFVMPETDRGVGFFSDESRVLVTCRNKRIVSSKDFAVHDAEFLGKEASRKLFCCHAFKEEHAPLRYEGHVKKFIAKCGGLPLALEVAGKFLYMRRDEAMWNGAFQRLSAAKPLGESKTDALWSIFEVIYEDLQEEEEQMFLDIAACFHGDTTEIANLVWRCLYGGNAADVGWQNLVDIGFVRLNDDDFPESIWMHELLRDFGRRKANPGSIESYSRVLCYQNNNKPPPWPFKEGTTPKVEFLKIAVNALLPILPIDIERLRGLENLKVLLLDGVTLFGSFNLLPDNLEFLIMKSCGWTARSSKSGQHVSPRLEGEANRRAVGFGSHGFRVLKVKSLWAQARSARQRGQGARSSKSVSNAVDRYDTPRDGWCSTLGESSAPKSGQHVSLRHVEFRECHHFVPEQGLFSDPLFPDHSFEHLPALKYLRITGDSLTRNRRSFDTPGSPGSIYLPDSLRELSALETLTIDNVRNLYLPETLGQLPALKQLDITDCQIMTGKPYGQLSSLENLFHPFHCKGLPSTLGELRALQRLHIREYYYLERLPDSLGQLQSLRELEIDCDKLTALPDTLGQLGGLRKLTIRRYRGTALPDNLGQLDGLREFKIQDCVRLTSLPDNLGQLDGLRQLKIKWCSGLTSLPDNLGQLGGLRQLKISWCSGLRALPGNVGQLGGLRELKINQCSGLTALPDSLGQLSGLRELKIKRCSRLAALPNNLGQLSGLQRLVIDRCWNLETLPDALEDLHALQHLEVTDCRKLEALPDTVTKLHCVKIFKKCDPDFLSDLLEKRKRFFTV